MTPVFGALARPARESPVIFLVEDNPADIRLTQEVLREAGVTHRMQVARDGAQALAMLRRLDGYRDLPEPDLILLDLNLPRKDGRQVLAEIKQDPELRHIPVIVLSTSHADADIAGCYQAHANCYLTKPVDLEEFSEMARVLAAFWLRHVRRAPKRGGPRQART
ncbi:MAG: response regulator [Gammaproteobacteria bacterium]|nr:response regulator [Gammaproteobacteria bacterium]